MNALYNLAIRAYETAVKLASGSNPKALKMIQGRQAPLPALPPGQWAWFHAASLGEFEQGRPMMERLKKEKPEIKILLTFFSPSGYEVRKNFHGVDHVAYIPFDKPSQVRRFLDAVNPEVAIFIKYEFWGNCLQELARRRVPVYLISGIFRKGQIFFRPYGAMMRPVLRCFKKIFVQDPDSKQLLATIGVTNVAVAGDTRFDRVTRIASLPASPRVKSLEKWAPGSLTLVVGSSWPEDESLYIPWLKNNPGVKAIIAPHEFDAYRLGRLQKDLGDTAILFSQVEHDPESLTGKKYVIIDCFGLLSSIYRYGDIAYVGGGFGSGIHNINEAAVYGIPVVFGPRHEKFREAKGLTQSGGGFPIDCRQSCHLVLDKLSQNSLLRQTAGKASSDFVRSQSGATDLMFKEIFD